MFFFLCSRHFWALCVAVKVSHFQYEFDYRLRFFSTKRKWLNFIVFHHVFRFVESTVLALLGATNCRVNMKIMRWQMQQGVRENGKRLCVNRSCRCNLDELELCGG